jgi:hypothetical protein
MEQKKLEPIPIPIKETAGAPKRLPLYKNQKAQYI